MELVGVLLFFFFLVEVEQVVEWLLGVGEVVLVELLGIDELVLGT